MAFQVLGFLLKSFTWIFVDVNYCLDYGRLSCNANLHLVTHDAQNFQGLVGMLRNPLAENLQDSLRSVCRANLSGPNASARNMDA